LLIAGQEPETREKGIRGRIWGGTGQGMGGRGHGYRPWAPGLWKESLPRRAGARGWHGPRPSREAEVRGF